MWKSLTAHINEEIYQSVVNRELFPEEQRGSNTGTRGTGDLLNIDQHNLKREQNETEKCSHGVDWLQEGQRYGPTKLDNKLLKCIRYPTKLENLSWKPWKKW